MPDERETPTPPEDQEREASLDQETLDALVGDSNGEDLEDLESLLSDLDGFEEKDAEEGNPDIATDASDMDNMEALIDQMESDGEAPADDTPAEESPSDTERDEMNDLLYQATLSDVEQAEGDTEDSPAEGQDASPEDDLESLLSDLDGSEEESEDMDSLLDDFKTVQENLISGGDEAGSITATILFLDDDEDNRTLFKDALDVSYETSTPIQPRRPSKPCLPRMPA